MAVRPPGKLNWIGKPLGLARTAASAVIALPRAAQITNAPMLQQRGFSDVFVNLLMTTLAVVAVTVPPGKPYSDSAPQARYQGSCEQRTPLIPSQIRPPPRAAQWSESAPQPKYQVQCEQQQNRIPSTIAIPPRAQQWIESAPQPKFQVQCEQQSNRVPSAIQNPPRAVQWSDSAPAVQRIGSDSYLNLLTTTLTPVVASQPPGKPYADSAPSVRYSVSCDQPSPQVPSQIRNPPRAAQWSDSAPQTQRVAQDSFPNLSITTLAQVAATAPFKSVDFSTYQAKFQVQDFQFSNLLPLQPTLQAFLPRTPQATNAPVLVYLGSDSYTNLLVTTLGTTPVVTPPPTFANYGGGGGGWRHKLPKRHHWKKVQEIIDEVVAELYSAPVEIREEAKAIAAPYVEPDKTIDYAALAKDSARVGELFALWNQLQRDLDDEDWIMFT